MTTKKHTMPTKSHTKRKELHPQPQTNTKWQKHKQNQRHIKLPQMATKHHKVTLKDYKGKQAI